MNIPKIQLPRKATYTRLEEDIPFFELFQKIERKFENCFLLESLEKESYDSRYSILGFDPQHIVYADGNSLYVDNVEYPCDNPYYALRELIPTDVLSVNYAGGLVGFICYEGMNYFEPSLNLKPHKDFHAFHFGIYLDGIILDKMTGETFYFYYENNRIERIMEIIQEENISEKSYKTNIEFLGYTMSEAEHKGKVLEVLEEVKAGNTFQCQLGLKAEYKITGDTFPIYQELRNVNPSPHMYYLKFGEKKIIGASPELLFRLRNGEMETFPLAGSIKRGLTPDEDIKLARTLLNDPKEIAEHNMLVDLHRNDLGRVAKYGTVKVRKLMEIKKYSHIQHISSEIIGIIKRGEDMFSGLASSFPAGTLSGAPKIESMKIIQRVENNPRGPYGGALGHFGFNGNCTFAIPIRTLFVSGDYGYTQASGGIVFDSVPQSEYQEIKNKLGAQEKVLNSFISRKIL
ncbi:MAG TPA: anthranilate synthase component I family protein [Leptospiraceae bacterium]|nr:anthranilate synthase component I family protein [Leptospiraceae bacterium]HMW03859.1 anthranilate synthase component I family protein [Leptospiraceae bacterium]HMX34457.1 anthranilate synthase component I family protein [Leptospiraceae bacterium]HMY29839.1 anthranilate synthase component I family protein [Leptospiraceae bacterium]HNA07834.1 anthranilate synthase component I family protein [Leptospiraceae bacterium]